MESEDHGDVELTMQDVLEEERELEEDAKAVLGDSDDKNCTYSNGYLSRQALYSCVTCSSDSEPGGICLACTYACHEGHELFELYTKRHFRCDCGNKRFQNNQCQFNADKEPENPDNKYNQNFVGKYCTCSRPYPDMDDNTPDAMIQCVMCEDWYHGRHLGSAPENEEFGEMICFSCMKLHPFLYAYTTCFASTTVDNRSDDKCDAKTENDSCVDIPKKIENDESAKDKVCKQDVAECSQSSELSITECGKAPKLSENENKVVDVTVEEVLPASVKIDPENTSDCILLKLNAVNPRCSTETVYWPEGWRKVLCKCLSCMGLYEKNNCLYLLDEGDTIHAYEERGKSRSGSESQYDKGWSALSSLDRVKQIEAVSEYKKMESQLKDYLKQFVVNKQAVSKRDITEFFENMRNQKRQKVESHIPTFCR